MKFSYKTCVTEKLSKKQKYVCTEICMCTEICPFLLLRFQKSDCHAAAHYQSVLQLLLFFTPTKELVHIFFDLLE